MSAYEKSSVLFRSIGDAKFALTALALICLPVQVLADDVSATGRASAQVIDPVSITNRTDMTFVARNAAGRTRLDGQEGQLEIKAAAPYAFSLSVQNEARATSVASGDIVVVDRITGSGTYGLAGHEWLGPDGTSTIRISGRLANSNRVRGAHYAGSIMVNIAYN